MKKPDFYSELDPMHILVLKLLEQHQNIRSVDSEEGAMLCVAWLKAGYLVSSVTAPSDAAWIDAMNINHKTNLENGLLARRGLKLKK